MPKIQKTPSGQNKRDLMKALERIDRELITLQSLFELRLDSGDKAIKPILDEIYKARRGVGEAGFKLDITYK